MSTTLEDGREADQTNATLTYVIKTTTTKLSRASTVSLRMETSDLWEFTPIHP